MTVSEVETRNTNWDLVLYLPMSGQSSYSELSGLVYFNSHVIIFEKKSCTKMATSVFYGDFRVTYFRGVCWHTALACEAFITYRTLLLQMQWCKASNDLATNSKLQF